MKASVIIPALNASATIDETLACLSLQETDFDFEVIVVDDGSDDHTASIVESFGPAVRLLKQERGGPASARNRGAKAARGEFLAFTDADCFPRPDWLAKGVSHAHRADLVQGQVLPDPRVAPEPFDRTISVTREYGLYETANLIVNRAVFEELGGFEDWLPVTIGKPLAEDVWFAWRLRRSGRTTTFATDVTVHHAVFRRSARDFIAERARLAYFPAMVAQIPELREAFLYRRWFLNVRSLRFDLMVIAVVTSALAVTQVPLALPFAIALAAPYLWTLGAEAVRLRRRAPIVVPAQIAADVVGAAALLVGAVRWRTLVA